VFCCRAIVEVLSAAAANQYTLVNKDLRTRKSAKKNFKTARANALLRLGNLKCQENLPESEQC